MSDPQQIERLLTEYLALAQGGRFLQRRRFWDADEPMPILAPEELTQPLIGWAAIEAYWSATAAGVAEFRSDCSALTLNVLAPDCVMAVFRQDWRAQMRAGSDLGSEPLAASVRVSMAWRRRDPDWRIFASFESHLEAGEYARSLARARAAQIRASSS